MSETPKVTVIVPVYNAGKWLRRCVDSILEQTFADFELLLVDDGSTDDSAAIADEYAAADARVRVFHKPNGGVSSARNLGLDHARGEWITFVDADDWVSPDYLEKLHRAATDADADAAMCDCYFVYPDRTNAYQLYSWDKQGIEGLKGYISSVWTFMHCSLTRRQLFEEAGLRCPLNISFCEDFHLMVRLLEKAKYVAKVNEPLYYYRQNPESVVHNQNEQTMLDQVWVYNDII